MAAIGQWASMLERVENHRFATLDGLRGVAALAVVLFHATDLSPVRMASGFLAVDLFFILSGFVMAEVYGGRFSTGLAPGAFLRLRIIRLYPLYFVGAVFGLVNLWGIAVWRGEALDWAHLLGFLMIPSPGATGDSLFPINPVAWSLLAELAINIVFGFFAWRWKTLVLLGTAAVLGICLIAMFDGTNESGSTIGSAHVGFLRAGYGFTIGMVIERAWSRTRRSVVTNWSLVLPITLLLLLALPHTPWMTQVLVLAVLPAIVALGARIEPRARKVALASGALSYALYCIHGPVLNLARFLSIRSDYPQLIYTTAVVMVIVLAWGLDRFYDANARKFLAAIWAQKRKPDAGESANV